MNELLWVSSIPLAYLLYRGTKVTYNDVIAYYRNKELENLSNEKFTEKVKIIGVGGGGSAIVEYLSNKYPNRYDSIILNSDKKALTSKNVTNKIHLEKPSSNAQFSNSIRIILAKLRPLNSVLVYILLFQQFDFHKI